MKPTAFCTSLLTLLIFVASSSGQDVEKKLDIPYAGTDNPRQKLDLLLPKERGDQKLPVIAFIHGGGWQNGDKSRAYGQLMPFVRSGNYAGVSIGYRLTDEGSWPVQIHDCKAAIRWIRANADKYGLDPDRIGIMGSSAGGHLVAMLGTSGGVASLEGNLGDFDDTDSRVKCVVDLYGPTELLTMGNSGRIKHDDPGSPESKLVGGPLQERKDVARSASPITHVTKDDAPILIVHGTNDPLVPFEQSVSFENRLKEAGVDATLITIEGGTHGGFRNPKLRDIVSAFFDKHLRGIDAEIKDETLPNEPRP